MKMVKRSKHCILPILFFLFLCLTETAPAKDKLYAGFTRAESITSLSLNKDWHQKEMSKILWPLLYDQLWVLGPAPEYNPLPSLASSWETKDRKTWRFFLNPEAMFSDGYPVTAADVLFSFKLLPKLDPKWNSKDLNIISATIIDDITFDITLDYPHGGPYPPFYMKPVFPRHIWKKHENHPSGFRNSRAIGSGAYILDGFVPGELLKLIKNPAFTGHEARFDELFFMITEDSKDLQMMLNQGMIDLFGATVLDPVLSSELSDQEGMRAIITPDSEIHWLTFNLSRDSAISDVRLRKALMTGINKSELIANAFDGYAKPINSFIYPELAGYNESIESYTYNPDFASDLLHKSDYRDIDGNGVRSDPKTKQDLSFSLMVLANNPRHRKMANTLQQQAIKIGIQLNPMQVAPFVYFKFLNAPLEGGFDIAIESRRLGPYSDSIWQLMKSGEEIPNRLNTASYHNPAFDQILKKMLATADHHRRIRYLHLMQEITADELPYGLLVRPYTISPIRDAALQDISISMGGLSSELNPWIYLKPELTFP